jgi:hypothetical protein
MHKFQRTVAAIAAASLMAAFAAQANKGAHYHKQEAADEFKWFVTAGANYLVPSYDAIDYASITNTSVSGVRSAVGESVDPSFSWGYMVAAGYMIREDFDIQASWMANTNESDSSVGAGAGNTLTLSNGHADVLTGAQTATASSNEKLTYEQFDLHIGQYHEMHESLDTRVFAGIRYAKVDLDVDNRYTSSNYTGVAVNDYDSKFSGWGPQVGMDLEYKAWEQVGIVGRFAGAFLVGKQEASSTTAYTPNTVQANVKAETETRLVPAIDAKLGMNVYFPLMDTNDAIVVEGGYQAAYYFNAVNQINADSASASTYENNYSDVGLTGPYLNISARW